jgi:hypothetical protein
MKTDPNPSLEALEHGGILEHVGYDHEPDPATPDEDVLELRHLAILPGHFPTIRFRDILRWKRRRCGGSESTFAVKVMLSSWQFQLSSHSTMEPRYTSPVLSSTVTTCPAASCSSFTGIPRLRLIFLLLLDLA